jgi:hypothetical protein
VWEGRVEKKREVTGATRIDEIGEGEEGGSSPAIELALIPVCQDPDRIEKNKDLEEIGTKLINCKN